jgi:hypothetical protein
MTKTISTSRTTFWLLALGAALLLTFAATTTAARAANGGDDPVAHNVGDDSAAQAPAGVVLPTAGSDDPVGHDANDDRVSQVGAPPATRTDDPVGHDANDDRVTQRPAVVPTAKKRHHKRADDRTARRGALHTAKHHGETGAHA